VGQSGEALRFASDELLLDSTFASDAKKHGFVLKVSMLSGRYMCHFVRKDEEFEFDLFDSDMSDTILSTACAALGLRRNGAEVLVNGTDVIPLNARVQDWPGLRPLGDISEFQLVIRQDA